MKPHQVIWALALFVFLIGILGYVRTGAAVPILINGVIAAITFLIAFMLYQKVNGAWFVSVIWLIASVVLYGYMTFFQVEAHASPRPGQPIIFGSMALFALIALVVVLRSRR